MSNYNFLMKFILIGDSGVGKTCFLYQYLENKFSNSIEPTIGIEFGTKLVQAKDKSVRLQIWDSAGQENYRSITRSYYRNTICSFLVYDISNKKSFDSLKVWHEEATTYGNQEMYFVLIGNKCELNDKREVTIEEARDFAREKGMQFFETSAKMNINVQTAFQTIVEKILEDIEMGKIDPYNETLGVKVGLNSLKQNILSSQQQQGNNCC